MQHRAQWGVARADETALILTDVGPHDRFPSITNDAEAVVAAVAGSLGDRPLYYVDTEGRVDRLLVHDGRFAGFAPGWRSLEEANAALDKMQAEAHRTDSLPFPGEQ